MNRSIHLLLAAAAFAAERHRRQRRKDAEATPYINQPLEVARLLADVGRVRDPEFLAACSHAGSVCGWRGWWSR